MMKRYIPRIIQGILVGVLLFLLLWRYRVSQARFFDVDEFSYLHWAANIAKGQRPYVDFFLIFTPGFLWVFAPIVKLFWMNAQVFLAARAVSFLIFVGILGSLGHLWKKTRTARWTLLPIIILAFLPMPYDKFLEIRPDNMATLLAFVGLIAQVIAILTGKKSSWFMAGALYMLSLIIFVKTIPFLVVGTAIALIAWRMGEADRKGVGAFAAGLAVPAVLLLLYFLSLGDLGLALYSVGKLPFETTQVGKIDIMESHLFFFPNASFYGGWGITPGLMLNHLFWLIGVFVGVLRLFTPFVTAGGDRKKTLVEALIAGTFITSVYGYVQFFPLKHSQYLIPIAIFIAYYCADGLVELLARLEKRATPAFLAILVLSAFALVRTTVEVNAPKLAMHNGAQIAETEKLLTTVPEGSAVVDLEGKMLFWPDGYYICCVAFGSFTRFMTRQPPAFSGVLAQENIPYIYQGDSNRLGLLSAGDREYISTYYAPVAGWDDRLWARR